MIALNGYEDIKTVYHRPHASLYCAIHAKSAQPMMLLHVENPTPSRSSQIENNYTLIRKASSDHVAKVHDLVNTQTEGQKAITLVYAHTQGISLKDYLSQNKKPIYEVLNIGAQLSAALADLHTTGITHGGLKPDGITVNPQDQSVTVTDFEHFTQDTYAELEINDKEMAKAVLPYISPEQTGRTNHIVDHRTDLYSLGVILYESLTGSPPFSGDDPFKTIHSHLAADPPEPSDMDGSIPQIISDMVMRLLAKAPEDRYQGAWGIKLDLEQCLHQWSTEGTTSPFVLGVHDVPHILKLSQKLYGRQTEIKKLLNAFGRICSGATEIMLVAGRSGMGKTSLVKNIRKPLSQKGGYFISGKFDQLKRNIPYVSLIQAFDDLIGQILSESKEQISEWKTKLQKALGPNGQVIIDIIPDLELIIGKQQKVPQLGAAEAQNRLNYVFGKFIRTFADSTHPLTIFLDDLQWADSPSLKLIDVFITADTKYLLIIGAYRNNEVASDHPLMQMMESIRKTNVPINTLKISPLEKRHINRLIADTLMRDTDKSKELALICETKTRGNPFFLNQYIRSLYYEKQIVFDFGQGIWTWDTSKINETAVTDNVVDFMAAKIEKLSHKTRQILKIAACIGNSFDLDVLAAANERSEVKTAEELKESLKDQLIIPDNADGAKNIAGVNGLEVVSPIVSGNKTSQAKKRSYRFIHDRVQQAAYSLIEEKRQKQMHLQIARLMLKNSSQTDREERIFDIVNQFNRGIELITDHNEKDFLAKLNLQAGKKAKASAAFGPAFNYLKTGLDLLGDDRWNTQYDLVLGLHEEAAECAYLTGDFKKMDQLCELVFKQSNRLLDRIKVYEIKIQALAVQNKFLESVKTGLLILEQLGVRFPENPGKFHVVSGLLKTKITLAGKRVSDLINSSEMTDPYKLAVMRILTRVGTVAYLAVPKLFLLIVLKGVDLSVKYGNAPDSAACYISYGIVLCSVMGNIETGYHFGKVGYDIHERVNAKKAEARVLLTLNIFIKHWKRHLQETLPALRKAYHAGLETGDLEDAGYAALMYCQNAYFTGNELSGIDKKMARYSHIMKQIKQESSLQYNQIFHQTVLNLIGKNENPLRLVGESYNEEKMLPLHIKSKDESAICDLHFNKLVLCYLFYDYLGGVKNSEMAEAYLEAELGLPHFALFYFYDSLTRLALFGDAAKLEKKRTLRKVANNQKKIKKWARYAPMNFSHKYALVDAELSQKKGNINKAMDQYDCSITLARKNAYVQEEALANERAALFYLSQNRNTLASAYMQQARICYLRWGAQAKVKQLENLYNQFFENEQPGMDLAANRGSLKENKAYNLGYGSDLISVIRAVKTIAGEEDPGQLLGRLMTIVTEHAGARKGYLVLKRDDNFIIEARVSTNNKNPSFNPIPIEACDELSPAVIHYVIRTGKDVLLDDAVNADQFNADRHISQKKIKSILCMPILDHGRMTGALYLENRSIVGAFTPERVKILRTVSEILSHAWAKRESEENLLAHREQLRSLSSQMLLTEERERRRIAVDLHDRIGHALANIMLRLGALKQEPAPETSGDLIKDISTLVEQCIEDTHSLTFDISPPILYDLGLEAALDWLVEQTRTKHNIMIRFEDDEQPKPLEESGQVLLFQAARELLFNMVKHSCAASGTVSISRDEHNICIVIQDDGVGFDPAASRYDAKKKGGFGLFSIQERLTQQEGTFTLDSAPGQGTRIAISLPMNCDGALE